jgi:hypothetical protein
MGPLLHSSLVGPDSSNTDANGVLTVAVQSADQRVMTIDEIQQKLAHGVVRSLLDAVNSL